jgi:ubiquinone/menaquinone biosynthesis C-methylase UbiE
VEEMDSYNPQSILLHDRQAVLFKERYQDELMDYHVSAFQYGRRKIEFLLLDFIKKLTKNSLVLDLGCGTGFYLRVMKESGFRSIGVDKSKNMIQQAKQFSPSIPLQIADAKDLPFANDTFDLVISIETMRYFEKRELLLKEIFRVTKPGGRIFISAAPFLSTHGYGLYNSFCRLLKLRPFVSCFQSFETVSSFNHKLMGAGFNDINISACFFGPFSLLEKFNVKLNSLLMKKFENLSDKLAECALLKNFSNHLVATARKAE